MEIGNCSSVVSKDYCFSSDRICNVYDSPQDKHTIEEEKYQDCQCYICYEISLSIQECKTCERIFCNKCISDIQKSKNSQDTLCPNSCSPWALDKPHRSVRNAIELIEFYCLNKKQGCEVKLNITTAQKHEKSECAYSLISCEGCHKNVSRKCLEDHKEKECESREVICENCEIQYLQKEKSSHNCLESLKKEVGRLKNLMQEMYTKEEVELMFISSQKIQQANDELASYQVREEVKSIPNEVQIICAPNECQNDQDKQIKSPDECKNKSLSNIFKKGLDFINNQKAVIQQKAHFQNPFQKFKQQPKDSNPQKSPLQNQNSQQVQPLNQGFQQQQPSNQNPQKQLPSSFQAQIPQNQQQQFLPPPPPSIQQNVPPQMIPPSQGISQFNEPLYPPSFIPSNNYYQNQPQSAYSSIQQGYQYPPQQQQSQQQNQFSQYSQSSQPIFNSYYSTQPNQPSYDDYYLQQSQNQAQSYSYSQNYQYPSGFGISMPSCDHTQLVMSKSQIPVNKICKCNKYLQQDYYYCNKCNYYMCVSCKN